MSRVVLPEPAPLRVGAFCADRLGVGSGREAMVCVFYRRPIVFIRAKKGGSRVLGPGLSDPFSGASSIGIDVLTLLASARALGGRAKKAAWSASERCPFRAYLAATFRESRVLGLR